MANNGTLRRASWIVGIVGGLLMLAGICMAIGRQNERLDANIKEDEEVHAIVQKDHDILIQQQTTLTHISKGIDEIKKSIEKQHP